MPSSHVLEPDKLAGLDLQSHSNQSLQTVDSVLERLRVRSKGFTNFDVEKVSQLGIHWSEADTSHRKSGYYARVSGRDMLLTEQAIRGASKMVRVADIRYWNQFPDKDAFPKTLRHVLENPATSGNRANAKRLLVRHDGIKVRAIQPFTYRIKDAYDLLTEFVTMLTDSVGEIQGISSIEEGEPGDVCSYRCVLNKNIMPMLPAKYGQHMMFLLATSETGANVSFGSTAATALGLYRTTCLNSAIREKLVTKWNHRSKGLDKFLQHSGERIEQIAYYQNTYAEIFRELLRAKLDKIAPRDLLCAFNNEKLITSGHYDAALAYIDSPTEDGRSVETQYDMFNVLTRSAQDLETLAKRQAAETRALHLFTEQGGVFERLRNAAEERAKEQALRKGGELDRGENRMDSTYDGNT